MLAYGCHAGQRPVELQSLFQPSRRVTAGTAPNPLRRLASRADFLSDPRWESGLDRLAGTDLRCGLEVFSPQLPELIAVVRRHPDIGFTVAVMGWPLAHDPQTEAQWRASMTALNR